MALDISRILKKERSVMAAFQLLIISYLLIIFHFFTSAMASISINAPIGKFATSNAVLAG